MSEIEDDSSIQSRVNKICNEMYANGIMPSVRLVLSEITGVGGRAAVHKHFAIWRSDLEVNQKSLYEQFGLSSEFARVFLKEISRFEAEHRYKAFAKDLGEQRDLAVNDLANAEERLDKQSAAIEQKDKQIKEIQVELLALKRQNNGSGPA